MHECAAVVLLRPGALFKGVRIVAKQAGRWLLLLLLLLLLP
jgi:hypothetical protein